MDDFLLFEPGNERARHVAPEIFLPFLQGMAQMDAKRGPQDPYSNLERAESLTNEMNLYVGRKPDEKIRVPEGQGSVETTVQQRLRALPGLIRREFEQAIEKSEAKNFVKCAELLTNVEQAIRVKQYDRPLPKELSQFAKFSITELSILQTKLELLVDAPRVVREKYATFLADEGDLAGASKQLKESLLFGSSPARQPLHSEIGIRLHREAAAGGTDPLELARSASRALAFGDKPSAEALFDRACNRAEALDYRALEQRRKSIETELKSQTPMTDKKREDLRLEQTAISELLHSRAATKFSRVQLAVVNGKFGEAQNLLRLAAATDPDFVTDRQSDFLDLLMFSQSEGKQSSVFDFHNELVRFQRYLGPNSFDPDLALACLSKAQDLAKALPMTEIEQLKKAQSQKIEKLENMLDAERDFNKQAAISKELQEAKLSAEGLELLKHAPAYCKLMEGVFALATKNPQRAKEIFDEVERADPEYAKKAATQLQELRNFADMPEAARKEESWVKTLLREIGYSAAAIAAGALAVVATGWSGPAAIGAGFATGAAVRSGLKYAVEGEISWYDPLLGGVDGLSGGVGVLAKRAVLNRLSSGGATVGAAERALVATGMDMTVVQGLNGADKINRAQVLARQGVAQMGKELPLFKRTAVIGDAGYLEAKSALRSLGRLQMRNAVAADMAGAASAAAIYRGRQHGAKLFDGTYQGPGEFSRNYFGDVAGDALFAGLGSGLLRSFPGRVRDASPGLYGARDYTTESPVQEARLREIQALIAELDSPSNPQQVRAWYLAMPGPKVETLPQK